MLTWTDCSSWAPVLLGKGTCSFLFAALFLLFSSSSGLAGMCLLGCSFLGRGIRFSRGFGCFGVS